VLGDDPSVRHLEEKVADLLGFPAAVYVPSGTMANQIAIKLHTRHGDTVLCEESSHCYLFEGGAAAAFSGVQMDQIPMAEAWSDRAIERGFRSRTNLHLSPTTLLVVENTHNRGMGRVLDAPTIQRVIAKGKMLGLARHCDGARIWNAAAALGIEEKHLLAGFDSAAVCFSKGLGAPDGSAILGSREHMAEARVVRKRFGGGMRQAGFLAAAASYALEHHRERLQEDHDNIAALGNLLRDLPDLQMQNPQPETNMVYFRVAGIAPETLLEGLAKRGVMLSNMGDGWIRAVSHLGVTRPDALAAGEIVCSIVRSLARQK
jgi:threonine aldolase